MIEAGTVLTACATFSQACSMFFGIAARTHTSPFQSRSGCTSLNSPLRWLKYILLGAIRYPSFRRLAISRTPAPNATSLTETPSSVLSTCTKVSLFSPSANMQAVDGCRYTVNSVSCSTISSPCSQACACELFNRGRHFLAHDECTAEGVQHWPAFTCRDACEAPYQLGPANCRACRHRFVDCLLYTSPSPRDRQKSRMPS